MHKTVEGMDGYRHRWRWHAQEHFWWGSLGTFSRPDTLQHLPPVIWKEQLLLLTEFADDSGTGREGTEVGLVIADNEDN